MVSANSAVNPSPTIIALTERAMSKIPVKVQENSAESKGAITLTTYLRDGRFHADPHRTTDDN